MSGRLNGKVAIITGAASGQGAAAAQLFASHGARVAAFDLNEKGLEDLEAAGGEPILRIVCDVSRSESVRAGIDKVLETFGSINILYNNAGVSVRRAGLWDESQDGPAADITEELFDRVISINLKSQFLMSKYTIPHLIASGGGSIINVASVGGVLVGNNNNAYCMSKGGVLGLTLALAHTYGQNGIRTNVLCPGLIETPMIDRLLNDPDYVAAHSSTNPMRRLGQATEMASVGLFLASDDSSYVNGAVIPVDGGNTVRSA
jgi:NAD(P)-dependent dehydrogenase (short-subunit alcohol dehydrogenase family)